MSNHNDVAGISCDWYIEPLEDGVAHPFFPRALSAEERLNAMSHRPKFLGSYGVVTYGRPSPIFPLGPEITVVSSWACPPCGQAGFVLSVAPPLIVAPRKDWQKIRGKTPVSKRFMTA